MPSPQPILRLTHDPGRAIEIAPTPDAVPVLRYVYHGAPKPYFHPLLGPAGVPLTIYEPHDHLWHRGLWFTIKFLIGENFWEEHTPFGTQETDPYPRVTAQPDGAVAVASALSWRRPGGRSRCTSSGCGSGDRWSMVPRSTGAAV